MKWLSIATRKLMEDESKKNARLFLLATVISFFTVVLLLEIPFYLMRDERNFMLSRSTIRFRMQATLLDLYAEDIWRNGRRTLTTPFSTSTCSVSYKMRSLAMWSEYQCKAVDEDGRTWIYTSRYGDNNTSALLIPLLVIKEAPKELRIVDKQE